MGTREEFLQWVSKRKLVTRNKASLRMNSDESQFLDYRVNDLWCAWQASRAAIEVELPFVSDSDLVEFKDECRESIESIGLKVKP